MISPTKTRPTKRGPYKSRAPKLQHEDAVLISLPKTVKYTGFSLCLTYQKARAGKLPGAAMIDGRWWVHKPKLLAWLDSLGTQSAA